MRFFNFGKKGLVNQKEITDINVDDPIIYIYLKGYKKDLNTFIDLLDLSQRTRNSLINAGITKLKDLIIIENLYKKYGTGPYVISKKDIREDLSEFKGLGIRGVDEVYKNLVGNKFEIDGQAEGIQGKIDDINKNFILTKGSIRLSSNQAIELLNLPERTRNALHKNGIYSIGELLNKEFLLKKIQDNINTLSENDIKSSILNLKGLGTKGIDEIKCSLVGYNFVLEDNSIDNINSVISGLDTKLIDINTPIISCGFGERVVNALDKNGIKYIKDLLTNKAIESIISDGNGKIFRGYLLNEGIFDGKGFGKKAMEEINKYLFNSVLISKINNSSNDIIISDNNIKEKIGNLVSSTLFGKDLIIFNKKSVFGNNNESLTLEAVALELGITRERVRQVLLKAEKKVKLAFSMFRGDNYGKLIINNIIVKNGEVGVINCKNKGSKEVNSELIALFYKEILVDYYDSFYIGNNGKESDNLLIIKKGAYDAKALLKGLKAIDKFVNEARPIDRHFYIANFFENVIKDNPNDIEKKYYLYYLKYEHGVLNDNGVLCFKSNKTKRAVIAAQLLFYEKDGTTYNKFLNILKREYPQIEWSYSIVGHTLSEYGRKDNDKYFFNETGNKKLFNIFQEEEQFKDYRESEIKINESSWQDKDYSNTKYYFLMEKIKSGYRSDSMRKTSINDYLYKVYLGEEKFLLSNFIKIFVSTLSDLEKDILKFDLQFMGNYDSKTNREILENHEIGVQRLIQIKDKVDSKLNAIFDHLTQIELYDKIYESVIEEFKISQYCIFNASNWNSSNDDANGKFVGYALKKILSKKLKTKYLSLGGNDGEILLIFDNGVINEGILNTIFEKVDSSYYLIKNSEIKTVESFIDYICDDKLKLEYFLNNQGYKYFLKLYLHYTYDIMIDNGVFSIPKLNLDEFGIDEDKARTIEDNINLDIYSDYKIDEIFNNLKIPLLDKEGILNHLGYRIKRGYIIKKTYYNFKDYLDYRSKEKEIIHINKNWNRVDSIVNTIVDYRRNYKIFRINDEIYVPSSKMEEFGINSNYINNFFEDLKRNFGDKNFFSVYNVKNKINVMKISELGFDDEFIENLITYNSEISFLQIKGQKIFSYNIDNLSLIKFIECKMEEYRSISLSNFVDVINDEYGINIGYDTIRNHTYQLKNIFYSQTMDKLYYDKEDYYNEVYNN